MGRTRIRAATAALILSSVVVVVVVVWLAEAPAADAAADAAGLAGGSRRLEEDEEADDDYDDEFGNFAGYRPTTDVTNWALLDRDQRSLESMLKLETAESFSAAKSIYLHGGHSFSHAVLDIDPPLMQRIKYTTQRNVTGLVTNEGEDSEGWLVGDYAGGEESISVLYEVPENVAEIQSGAMCMVGGLKRGGEEMTEGCFREAGTLSIGSNDYHYTYRIMKDTKAYVTLATTNKMASREMYLISDECSDCSYPELVQYQEYYQDMSFGHHWIEAALNGAKVQHFGRGGADFTGMSLKGRAAAVKKGTVYLNVFTYILRNMRVAVAECGRDNGLSAASSWDTAAALYVGSLEGRTVNGAPMEAQEANWGEFLYNLAELRCIDFRTCGRNGDSHVGTSFVNWQIMNEFAEGQQRIYNKACKRAESHLIRISDLMSVPLIQGTLKYAHINDEKVNPQGKAWMSMDDTREKRNAEGASFAAAILPRIHACSPDDAEVLYESMRVGTQYTDFRTVKGILEANYQCLGVTCQDVGGLYDPWAKIYFTGAEPCGILARASGFKGWANGSEKVVTSLLVTAIALIGLCCCIAVLYRKREAKKAEHNNSGSLEDTEKFSSEEDRNEETGGIENFSII